MRAGGERGMGPEHERSDSIWSYFDAYKQAGTGEASPRPEIGTFSHVTEENKEKDLVLVDARKSRPGLRKRQEGSADAFAFENYLTSQMMRNEWFRAKTAPASEYDDWISGVDAVMEWRSDEGPVRLAVDFTTAEEDEVFVKKSAKLEGNVTVKYLRSAVETTDEATKDMSVSMPVVLLGFDKSVFRHVAERHGDPEVHAAVERMLIRQAASQIDMQITLTVQRIFGSSRARRIPEAQAGSKVFAEAGDGISAERAIDLVRSMDLGTQEAVFSKKHLARFMDLVRLKEKVFDGLSKKAGETPSDPETEKIFERSKTHNVLLSD